MTLSPQGQITLPKAARERLGAVPGSKIVLVERHGRFELEAYGGDILRWYGAFQVDQPQDWAARRRGAIREGLVAVKEAGDEPQND